MINFSEVTAFKLFSPHERLQVSPKVVALSHVMVPLVPLQFQTLNVPTVDHLRNRSVCIVDVVASHSRKQFSFSVIVLPLFELPVLSIYEDSNDTAPSRLCEIGYAIVHIELDYLVPNSTTDRNHLT